MLLEAITVQDVATRLKMNWNTVKEIDKVYLKKHFSKPRLCDAKYLAMDEFAVSKGHTYKTVVLNLETSQVLYIGDGRNTGVLDDFFKRLKSARAKIKAVAIDMWPVYIEAVVNHLPKAKIVYDRFHIVRNFNNVIDEARRSIFHEEMDLHKRRLMKGTRWLLLKNSANLNEEKNEVSRLAMALKINQPLAAIYYLKEDLQQLWAQLSRATASRFLDGWIKRARATGLFVLRKFVNSLLAHRTGIMNWFEHPISTGPLEGLNNKIKVLKRKAYGFRDHEYFALKIYAINQVRYAYL
jgi:transposase